MIQVLNSFFIHIIYLFILRFFKFFSRKLKMLPESVILKILKKEGLIPSRDEFQIFR